MLLERAELTASGRPALLPAEVERLILDKVDLEFEGHGGVPGMLSEAYKGGYVVLTTQRLIWMDNAAGPSSPARCCWLPMHSVQGMHRKSKMAFSGTKVWLQLELAASFDNKPAKVDGQFHKTTVLSLRCRGDGPEALMAKLQEVLKGLSKARQPSQAAHQQPAAVQAAPPQAAAHTAPPPYQQEQQQQQQQQQRQQPAVNEQLLWQLVEMGFPRNRSARSLLATQNAGCQQAIDYMLAYGDQPGMDDPLPAAAAGPAAAPSGYSQAYPAASQQYGLGQAAQPAYPQIMPVQGYGSGPGVSAPNPLSMPSFASGGSQPPSLPKALESTGPGFVGVTGIVRREEQKATDAGRSLSAAFQDLQALMGMAADMVKLAERFWGVISQTGAENEDELMDRDTQLQLIAMGITSPVTKEASGARYHMELSRQLADFLIKPLQQSGGIMTLPDVYCLYNRARGTELISPDDLQQAIQMFNQLRLPLMLRNLPSGLPVVQSSAHSDDEVCQRIAKIVDPTTSSSSAGQVPAWQAGLGPGVTASDVAKALAVSLPIAREHLLTAELKGVLCRDDGPEGLRFYHNFFKAVQ